jgi:hypothetical protein
MDSYKVHAILSVLIANRPWLNACMRDCVVTDVGKEHNLNHLFDKTAMPELWIRETTR